MSTLSNLPFSATLKSITAAIIVSNCLLIVNGCDAQNISSDSTVGSNNIAQTEPEIIRRNSMDDVAAEKAEAEDSDLEKNNSENSSNGNSSNEN